MDKNNRQRINSLLVDAAAQGDLENMMFLLMNQEANPNCTNLQGFTPLMAAALKGQSDAVETLIKWGADIHTRHPTGMTLMECALVSKDKRTLNILIQNGCKLFEIIEREVRLPGKMTEPENVELLDDESDTSDGEYMRRKGNMEVIAMLNYKAGYMRALLNYLRHRVSGKTKIAVNAGRVQCVSMCYSLSVIEDALERGGGE